MIIASIFTFIILLLTTLNLLQAFISVICVGIVLLSMLAVMAMRGWQIGVSESLSMVIMIGFSVDYVVHLSSEYLHSVHQSRNDKMKQAYSEMGISVVSGTFTTLGASLFLFGGQVQIFQKFGVLMSVTITFSFAISMMLFGALMHSLGP